MTGFAKPVGAIASMVIVAGCFGAPGDLYVGEWTNGTIVRITPDGAQDEFALGLSGPGSLAFDSKGNLFEADLYSGTIFKFTPEGIKSIFASGLAPGALAFDGAGNLFETDYAAGEGAVFKFAPDGSKSIFAFGGLISPSGLAFDFLGNLYVATPVDSGTIYKFARDGTRTMFASGLYNPLGIAFDASGSLYSTDSSGAIFKFGTDGAKTQFAFSPFSIIDLAFNASGNLFASAIAEDTILQFAPDGTQNVFTSTIDTPNNIAFEPITQKLRNLSARGFVGTGDSVLIGGFIVGGNTLYNNAIVARALGPSLSVSGISNSLQDPVLELHTETEALVASNDNWQDTQAAIITASGLAPTSPKESAIYVTLPSGNYTAVVRGANDSAGIALVEVYGIEQ